jgi:non-ribosomal peptide synthetase component E (peptide arylation enzyme)
VTTVRLFPDDAAQAFLDDGWWSGLTWSDLLERNRAARPDRVALVGADAAASDAGQSVRQAERLWVAALAPARLG